MKHELDNLIFVDNIKENVRDIKKKIVKIVKIKNIGS